MKLCRLILSYIHLFCLSTSVAIDIPVHSCRDSTYPLEARCHAHIIVDSVTNKPIELTPEIQTQNSQFKSQECTPANFVVNGKLYYGPTDLQSAYGVLIPTNYQAGTGPVVAVVVAYNYAEYEISLNEYRVAFCLPVCSVASGCLTKVNQNGVSTGPYPGANKGWNSEAAINMQMISAMCPWCKILLVIADSANMLDLGESVNTAAALGKYKVTNCII